MTIFGDLPGFQESGSDDRRRASPLMEHPQTGPLWGRLWKGRVRGVFRRLSAALFAVTLAFLTSVVHVSHTCHESSIDPITAGPGSHDAAPPNSFQQAPSAIPCLACMFLQAIRSTLVTAIVFIPCWMAFRRWLRQFDHSWHPLGLALSSFPIRAPPPVRRSVHL
jgi:hypothetical protein